MLDSERKRVGQLCYCTLTSGMKMYLLIRPSSGLWYRVGCCIGASVLEGITASIFTVRKPGRISQNISSIISQKTDTSISTAMITANLTRCVPIFIRPLLSSHVSACPRCHYFQGRKCSVCVSPKHLRSPTRQKCHNRDILGGVTMGITDSTA